MKSYFTDYTNHMLRVYYSGSDPLTEADKTNKSVVQKYFDDGDFGTFTKEDIDTVLGSIYRPCADFASSIDETAEKMHMKKKTVYSIISKVSRKLARMRGLT